MPEPDDAPPIPSEKRSAWKPKVDRWRRNSQRGFVPAGRGATLALVETPAVGFGSGWRFRFSDSMPARAVEESGDMSEPKRGRPGEATEGGLQSGSAQPGSKSGRHPPNG